MNPLGTPQNPFGGVGAGGFQNFIERLLNTLGRGGIGQQGSFSQGRFVPPTRQPGARDFGASFQGSPQGPPGGWLTPPGTSRDHDNVAEGRLNPILPSDPRAYQDWANEQDYQFLVAQMQSWVNAPTALKTEAQKSEEMRNAIRDAYVQSGGDPNKPTDEIISDAQAEAKRREEAETRQREEEQRKKEDEERYKIPKKGSNPNPDDPGDAPGPKGPWLRTRTASAHRSSDFATPNPDGPPQPNGPWMTYMPNPDDVGPTPAGPWAHTTNSRSARFASVAKPNPDDPRGDGGPRRIMNLNARSFLR